jgi:hypothetical protein
MRKRYIVIACILLFGCKHASKETKEMIVSDTPFEGSEIIDVVIDKIPY